MSSSKQKMVFNSLSLQPELKVFISLKLADYILGHLFFLLLAMSG